MSDCCVERNIKVSIGGIKVNVSLALTPEEEQGIKKFVDAIGGKFEFKFTKDGFMQCLNYLEDDYIGGEMMDKYIVKVRGITKDGVPETNTYMKFLNSDEHSMSLEELAHRCAKYQMEEPTRSAWNWDHVTEVEIAGETFKL